MQKADATMLSWETAAGNYPVESVKTMSNILNITEKEITYKHDYFTKNLWELENRKLLIKNAINTAENIWAKAMVVFSKSWFMAKTVSAFRPNIPVFSFSFSDSLRRKLAMLFGLKTFSIEEESNNENIENAISELKNKKILNIWDEIVTVYWIKKWDTVVPSIQVIKVK